MNPAPAPWRWCDVCRMSDAGAKKAKMKAKSKAKRKQIRGGDSGLDADDRFQAARHDPRFQRMANKKVRPSSRVPPTPRRPFVWVRGGVIALQLSTARVRGGHRGGAHCISATECDRRSLCRRALRPAAEGRGVVAVRRCARAPPLVTRPRPRPPPAAAHASAHPDRALRQLRPGLSAAPRRQGCWMASESALGWTRRLPSTSTAVLWGRTTRRKNVRLRI